MILLRKVAGRFGAVRRAMRSVEGRARSFTIASLCIALLLFSILAPIVSAISAVARADRGPPRPDASPLAAIVLVAPYRYAVSGGGGPSGSKTITIDHTKFGSSDPTDFALLFTGTYTYLKTVGNGGSVQNASGFDIGFYSDSGLTTKLKWEVEKYVASTGEIIAWVKVPSISHTADTVIYLGYGDASVTTFQGDAANTWASTVSLAIHGGDGSTLSLTDSTGYGNNGTNISCVAATGKVYGGIGCVGGNATGPAQAVVADAASLNMTNTLSVSAWVKFNNFTNQSAILGKTSSGNAQLEYYLFIDQSSHKPFFGFTQGSGNYKLILGGTAISTGTSYLVSGTYDGSNIKVYVNGVIDGTVACTGNVDSLVGTFTGIGRSSSFLDYADATIDEPRIEKGVAHTADWWLARFNAESAPIFTVT